MLMAEKVSSFLAERFDDGYGVVSAGFRQEPTAQGQRAKWRAICTETRRNTSIQKLAAAKEAPKAFADQVKLAKM